MQLVLRHVARRDVLASASAQVVALGSRQRVADDEVPVAVVLCDLVSREAGCCVRGSRHAVVAVGVVGLQAGFVVASTSAGLVVARAGLDAGARLLCTVQVDWCRCCVCKHKCNNYQ